MWIQHVNKKTVGALLFAGTLLSAPTRRVDLDHIGSHNFTLEVQSATGGFETIGTFKSVEGLDSEVEVIELSDTGDFIARKRPGRVKYGDIVLKKGYVSGSTLYQWRRTLISGETAKKVGRVTLLDDAGRQILRYNFFEAWPSKWKGYSLDGKGNDIFVEEVELAVERLERE